MMKNIKILLSILICLAATSVYAQSASAIKAAKSVFTLTTYKADGSILATSHGAYYAKPGEGIAPYKPFIGAHRAVIIDAAGNTSNVDAIIGANEMYDICRFRVSSTKGIPLSQTKTGSSGKLWVLGYNTKKADARPLTIKSTEKFQDKYNYYIFNEEVTEDTEGCPIINDAGEILGLVQRSSTTYDIHSTDVEYYSQLSSSGLSAHDPTLQKTAIRIALPEDHDQARLMIMMINAADDSINVVNSTAEYISRYPAEVDGYAAMARYEVSHMNMAQASKHMETAIKKAEKKDEAYYEYSKLIYSTVIYLPDSLSNGWNLDMAEDNINKAVDVNNLPIYRHQLAQIKYAKGDYSSALSIFEQLGNGDMATSEVFYEAAQCKTHLGASNDEILQYLDRAVQASPRPLTNVSAPFILARGIQLDNMGESKRALQDYNQYDTLMSFRANAEFYYTRYKCEMKLRQFQQAINDISHAAYLSPNEPTYLAELAALQLRVGQFEQAVQACDLCLRLADNYPDVYIVKGVALNHLGRKDESLQALNKAKQLGDQRADSYIEKFSKEK